MARICLITPGHLATNPRIVKEADALHDAGHDVTVIAADFVGWAHEADREFAGRPWRIASPIAFGPRASPAARLIQVMRQRAAGAAVSFMREHERLACAAWHPIGPDLATAARRVRADLYVAHYPAALPAAAIAARHFGTRYAYDAEDFHPGDAPNGARDVREQRLLRSIEERYLPGCSYVTAASPGIADAYVEAYGIPRPTVVLNVFPRSHAPPAATPAGVAQPGPSVYWFSQTIGPDRGLECAVRAVGRARSRPHLHLRGSPSVGFAARLRETAAQAGAAGRLHLHSSAAPSEMARLAARHDIGLSGEPGFCANNRMALGNKVFSYLLGGIPVLLSNTPAHQDFSRRTIGAIRLYPIDDDAALAEAIDDYLLDLPKLARARAAAFALGQERYNWDLEAKTLLAVVAKALRIAEPAAPRAPRRIAVQ